MSNRQFSLNMSTRSKVRGNSKVINEDINNDDLSPPIAEIDAQLSGDDAKLPPSESKLNQVQF